MGRELKRVPLDFKWAISQLWKGFLNPYNSIECSSCKGHGYNKETQQIADDWYDLNRTGARWCDKLTDVEVLALAKSARIRDLLPNIYFDKERNQWYTMSIPSKDRTDCEMPEMPSAELVNQHYGRGGFGGHDGINRMICVEARAKSLGVYGVCEYCDGEGVIWQSEEIKKLHEEWESFEPPTGEGFQLWNTTTEGHPMTPVFATLDELCQYCEHKQVSVFGSDTATKERWKEMLNDEFVCKKEIIGGNTYIFI